MPSFAANLEKTLHNALANAADRSHEYATLEHLLLALIDDPDAADPYGVWGADELDPEPAPAQQRVHLGRGRRA